MPEKKADNKPRLLGVLLCYNDADILGEQIDYLLSQGHDIIAWDHGSTDNTAEVLDRYDGILKQRRFIPRDFDFYELYPAMSQNLIDNFINDYDIISWPDQDEFLEGPKRDKSYQEYLYDFYNSPYTYLEFGNYVYWFTDGDGQDGAKGVGRMRHYSLYASCAPRIRAWKASVTNRREFNHNPLPGERYPEIFKLRHYPFRDKEHLVRRVTVDRAGLVRDTMNTHYANLQKKLGVIDEILPSMFHVDDGVSELSSVEKFDFRRLYGPTAQLFAAKDTAFMEENSLRQELPSGARLDLAFDLTRLPERRGITQFRFDPADAKVHLVLEYAKALDKSGKEIPLTVEGSNAAHQFDGNFIFDNDDPNILFSCETRLWTKIDKVAIGGELYFL